MPQCPSDKDGVSYLWKIPGFCISSRRSYPRVLEGAIESTGISADITYLRPGVGIKASFKWIKCFCPDPFQTMLIWHLCPVQGEWFGGTLRTENGLLVLLGVSDFRSRDFRLRGTGPKTCDRKPKMAAIIQSSILNTPPNHPPLPLLQVVLVLVAHPCLNTGLLRIHVPPLSQIAHCMYWIFSAVCVLFGIIVTGTILQE